MFTINPLSPHDALEHYFTWMKTNLIFLQPRVFEWKFPLVWFLNENSPETGLQYIAIFFNFHPLQIIFIHYKSRIVTAIRGL